MEKHTQLYTWLWTLGLISFMKLAPGMVCAKVCHTLIPCKELSLNLDYFEIGIFSVVVDSMERGIRLYV